MNEYSIEADEATMLRWKDGDRERDNSETPMTEIKTGANQPSKFREPLWNGIKPLLKTM